MVDFVVKAIVDNLISSYNDDVEASHGIEDALLEDIVRAVAAGDPEGRAMAQAALPLLDHERERWYA